MTLLGIDIGTTHLKAGLFDQHGFTIAISSHSMVTHISLEGHAYFDPDEVWALAQNAIRDVAANAPSPIVSIGVASMAETGLLVDRSSGDIRSEMIPWFDTAAQAKADMLVASAHPREFFTSMGIQPSYKCSLAKLLWLRDCEQDVTSNAVWLSAADYIFFKLTGVIATDYSLAGRTCAFNIEKKTWDTALLETWGLSPNNFPPAYPSGTITGRTLIDWQSLGLDKKTPVAVCGHDHVCGSLAAGATKPGVIFDSMGTAEVLIGTMPVRHLTETDYQSGLMVGCHVIEGQYYWMGGLSTSGGALEWLRNQLSESVLSYAQLLKLLESATEGPTGILFFPYLLGSSSPHRDSLARGGWVGLQASHTRADLAKAVLEGTAFEMQVVREFGEQLTEGLISKITVAGGGTRNQYWLQIKADVFGHQLHVCPEPETTLLGAALAAGVGSKIYADVAEVTALLDNSKDSIYPDAEQHDTYRLIFEQGYLPMQKPLRMYSHIDLPKR